MTQHYNTSIRKKCGVYISNTYFI